MASKVNSELRDISQGKQFCYYSDLAHACLLLFHHFLIPGNSKKHKRSREKEWNDSWALFFFSHWRLPESQFKFFQSTSWRKASEQIFNYLLIHSNSEKTILSREDYCEGEMSRAPFPHNFFSLIVLHTHIRRYLYRVKYSLLSRIPYKVLAWRPLHIFIAWYYVSTSQVPL